MPIVCDPTATFDLWCDSDAEKPAETRPIFTFRPPNGREQKELIAAAARTEAAEDAGAIFDQVFATLRAGIVGWRNLTGRQGNEIVFDPAELDAVLDFAEAIELLTKLAGHGMGAEDRKNAESPSPSNTDESAEAAPGGGDTPGPDA